MTTYTNHVTIAGARNATTSHTVHPDGTGGTVIDGTAFTPTSGRLLVCLVATSGGTTTTPSGWTLPTNGNAVGNTGLYVFHRTASGTSADQVATTHQFSNFPALFDFYEFPAGSTFVGVAKSIGNSSGGAGPTLSGLTGTNWTAGVMGILNSGALIIETTWNAGTEEIEQSVIFATTDGYAYNLTHTSHNTASSASYTPTLVNDGGVTHERLVFAVNVASSGTVFPEIKSWATYGSNASESSITVPLPSGWQAGDLCYIGWVLLASAPVVSPPSGWTAIIPQVNSQQNANTIFGILRRVLQAGDSAPVITGASGRWAGISVVITGYKTTPTEDTAATQDDGVIDTFPDVRIPSITSITPNALMLGFAVTRNGTSTQPLRFAAPAGMTEIADVSSTSSTNVAIELVKLELPTPTTTGVKIATPSTINGGAHTGPAPMGAAIVVRDAEAPDFEKLILLTEAGHQLIQEIGHHLLLQSTFDVDLEVTAFETAWTGTTDPLSLVIPSCKNGDWLFLISGSGQAASGSTTAMVISTTAGSTGSWTEPKEDLNSPVSEAWITSGVAQVTADGDVTVQVDITRSAGTPAWGFAVVRARNSSGLGNWAFVDSSAAKTANLTVSQDSAVFWLAVDFNAAAVGTAWTPSTDVTLIEQSVPTGNYTVQAALWDNQTAGANTYGYTGGGTPLQKIIALEIKK
jgi:hypothetical protein